MKTVTIGKGETANESEWILEIEGYGNWGLPDDCFERELTLSDLPKHESWCDGAFLAVVNHHISDIGYHESDRNLEAREKAFAVVGELVSLANHHQIDKVLDAIKLEHRTHQQALAGLVFSIIHHWSREYETNNFDLRNECAVMICKDIVDRMKHRSSFGYARGSKRPLPVI